MLFTKIVNQTNRVPEMSHSQLTKHANLLPVREIQTFNSLLSGVMLHKESPSYTIFCASQNDIWCTTQM